MSGRSPRPPWSWPGVVALTLTLALGIAICVIALGAAITEARFGSHTSQEASTLLSTVLGAAVGAIATFLGGHGRSDPAPPRPDEPPTEDARPTQEWPQRDPPIS